VSSGGNSSCTATANSGYRFTGFSGDCSGTTCTLRNVTSAKSVTANFAAIAIDGACGSAHGKPVAKAPSANLCQQGAASPLQGDGPWAWICQGQNNGLSALCQAGKTCEFAGSLLPGAGCPAGSTSSTPPLWSLGDRPGKNRYLVAADANIELTIRSTPRPGDAPTRQWLYYRLRQGGVTQPYHLLTPQGSVPLDAAQAALENYGYPFSPQGLTTLLRTTPQSLGLQAGDELLYGHAYFAADGTLITDNSVSIEVR